MEPTESPTPSLLSGFARRVVIPLLALAVILIPSTRVLQSASLPDLNYLLCQTHIIKSDSPPTDAVFFGSSRTGAAVDAVAIAGAFTGNFITAEKVVYTKGSEFDRDLAYRTYVEHRGVPRVLALEMSFERYTDRVEDEGSLLRPTGRSNTLFDTEVYARLISSLRDRGDASLTDLYVTSTLQSTGGFFFDRLGVGADQALRSPDMAFFPTDECKWKFKPRKGRWVVGNTKPFIEANAELPSRKKQERWTRRSLTSRPLDFDDPWTQQEILLLRDLVDTAYADGVETVILYYFPSFGEAADVIDLRGLQDRLPDAVIFDGRQVLNDPQRPSLAFQYNDANHLNKFAAYEVSVALAAMAETGEGSALTARTGDSLTEVMAR